VLAFARPILANSTWIEAGAAQVVDLISQGCGPGWHWSNRRGWNWGRCVRDWPWLSSVNFFPALQNLRKDPCALPRKRPPLCTLPRMRTRTSPVYILWH
jgi:hypothetical protein